MVGQLVAVPLLLLLLAPSLQPELSLLALALVALQILAQARRAGCSGGRELTRRQAVSCACSARTNSWEQRLQLYERGRGSLVASGHARRFRKFGAM